MRREARIVHRMLRQGDLYEGIRAAVIEKDGQPAWSPAGLADVTDEQVAAYFEPVPSGPLAALGGEEHSQ